MADCPKCKTPLETRSEPDVTVEACPLCGGLFLDHGELNTLAVGMHGDIEWCSAHGPEVEEHLPVLACPRCLERGEPGDLSMRKVSVLQHSHVILDYCDRCEGFWFDRGELQRMNAYLKETAGRAAEYREYHGPFLVRLDRSESVETVSGVFAPSFQSAFHLELRVYLEEPLGCMLLITPEVWAARLAKLFGKIDDLETGDAPFDRAFLVQGEDEAAVNRVLSDDVRRALLDFRAHPPRILGTQGTLEVYDDHLLYREGPYKGDLDEDLAAASAGVRDAMLALAEKIEAAR